MLRSSAAICLLGVLGTAAAATAETPWYESFEGPQTSWQIEGGDARFEVPLHDRVQGVACTGEGCERVRISGSGGTYVYLRHDVGRPRVIDELLLSVEIRSDRAGLQLAARVVLPRSVDPRTGRPLETVIQGSSYTKVGRWQQLRIEHVPEQLARRVRALRADLRTHVDPREAYVKHVLLNVYGGPGVTNVWIDDLDVAGHVATIGHWPLAAAGPAAQSGEPSGLSAAPRRSAVGPATGAPAAPRRVVLDGSVLLVDGRPFFPRIIQCQGESLDRLKRLGFNSVWLQQPPTAATRAEAKRLGLWLICPPPLRWAPNAPESDQVPPNPIGSQYDGVLAWDLRPRLSGEPVSATRRWAQRIRAADRVEGRPLVCRPPSDLRAYSRCADVLLLGRPVLGTSLELSDYGTWLRQRPRLARPGTPIWSTIQSQPTAALREQWSVLVPGRSLPTALSSEQIRLMVYTAITSASRGLLFESNTPLDASDPGTGRRAAAFELLNLELGLAEPWLAAGRFVQTVPGSEPDVLAAVLSTDRARLLVPIWSPPGAQCAAGQAAGNHASFVVPGVPEEYRPYLLTAGGLEPLRRKRETGGVRVTLDEFSLSAMVLLTQDPLVVDSLTRRVAAIASRAAELRRRLAAEKLQTVREVSDQLAGGATPNPQAAAWLAAAERSLARCDRLLASRDHAAAYLEADRAMRPLRLLERSAWEASLGDLSSPLASPMAIAFPTLPWHRRLMARTTSGGWSANALVGGDFEDLARMLQAGWRHLERPPDQVRTAAELAPEAARSGQFGLKLIAQPAQPQTADTVVETPPVWISSAPVYVDAGQLVAIHGWVQVPHAITGSVDGLMIIDSLSGEALAERIGQTAGWKEFTLYRAAPRPAAVTVTFALSGLGEAWVDDVTIHRLGRSAPLTRLGAD